MLVLDASVIVEFLLGTKRGLEVATRIAGNVGPLATPYLSSIEVLQTLRSLCNRGELSQERAREAIADLKALPVHRYPAEPLLERMWQSRHNLSAYDAHYVVLAQELGATVLTHDRKMSNAPGIAVHVEVID